MATNGTDTEGYAPFNLYPYNPNPAPAFAFLALFGICSLFNLAAMMLYRVFFPLPMVIGCGMEAAAYYFRTQSHDDVRKTLPFLIQNLLVLSAPPFLAATIYMSPRRIARALDCEGLLILRRWASKLFVIVDTACFVTQVAGSIMSGSEDADEASRGKTIILVGLILQVIAFGLFIVYAASLHVKIRAKGTPRLHWRRYFGGLYTASLLFVLRNLTRIVEFQQGPDGEIISHEGYLYGLDACIMLALGTIFLVLHPGALRRQQRREAKAIQLDDEIPIR